MSAKQLHGYRQYQVCTSGGLGTGTRQPDSRRRLTVVHVIRGHEGVVHRDYIDVLVVPRCSQDQPIRETSHGERQTRTAIQTVGIYSEKL